MTTEPKVPLSQRRGTGTEAEIKALLSDFSISAKQDPDIGIDYICELLSGDKPTGKFFGVQVKARKNIKDQQAISIKKNTVHHWVQLPFPGFLILSDKTTGECYWVSIIGNLAKLGVSMPTSSKTVSIEINKSQILNRGENRNQVFVSKVKTDMELLSLILGHPQFGEGYVRREPVAYLSSAVRSNLESNIRNSLNCLINHWSLAGDLERAYLLCEFLTKIDKGHYDHFYKFGKINKLKGNKAEAKTAFEEAISICRRDKNWNRLKTPSDPSIEEIIKMIEAEMEGL